MCKECEQPNCPGSDKLRHFANWEDLSAHIGEETLVKWVNHYAEMIEARNDSGRRYRRKQQMMAKVATQYLDKDELDRIRQLVEERMR